MADKKYLSYVQQGDDEYIIRDPDINKKLDQPIEDDGSFSTATPGDVLGIHPESNKVGWWSVSEYIEDKLSGKVDLIGGKIPLDQLPNTIYTSWEVNPTTTDYAAGEYTVDKYESLSLRREEDEAGNITPQISNKRPITAQTVHKFRLRSCSDYSDSDVIVDWGDGTTSTIAAHEYDKQSVHGAEYIYDLSHDYKTEGKFIIKIYGNCYFNITHAADGYNLISRVFDEDLPLAPHFKFLQNFCYGAQRLLYVNIPPHHTVAYAASVISLFAGCSNLRVAVGLSRMYTWSALYQLFYSCVSLLYTDLCCPTYVSNMSRLFCDCWSLKLNVDDFFNFPGFGAPTVNMFRAFYMGGPQNNMTGTLKPELFWNNLHTTFTDTEECFKNNTALSKQAPLSWGGTYEDIIVTGHAEDRLSSQADEIAVIRSNVEALESTLGALSESLDEVLDDI